MKKIRMGLMALAALSGVGGALAFTPKNAGTVYYGYKDASGNARWSASQPASDCQPDAKGLACTITSTSSNVTSLQNQFPAQHTVIAGAGAMYE